MLTKSKNIINHYYGKSDVIKLFRVATGNATMEYNI